MPAKDDFEREFVFDIDSYLISTYKKMSLTDRRAICTWFLQYADVGIEDVIDEWVANRALIQAGFMTLDELTKEEEDEDTES